MLSVIEQWKQNYYSHERRLIEVDTIVPGTGDSELYTLPNFGMNCYAIKLHVEGTVQDDATGALTLATNLASRLTDITIETGDGKKFIDLHANGGVQVATAANNPTIDPGDVRMYASPFLLHDELDRLDKASSWVTDGGGTELRVSFDIVIPVYVDAGEQAHRYKFRWGLTTGAAGTIYSAGAADFNADAWTVQVLVELLPPEVKMQKFGIKFQSVPVVVGDQFINNRLSKGIIVDHYIMHSPLPANVDDIFIDNGDAKLFHTEYDSEINMCSSVYGYCHGLYGIMNERTIGAGTSLEQGGFYNVVYFPMGQVGVTEQMKIEARIATAIQTMRIGELRVVPLGRPAQPAEQVTTTPAAKSPQQITLANNSSAAYKPQVQRSRGLFGAFLPQ